MAEKKGRKKRGPDLKEQLREAIRQSGRSLRSLGREVGISADRLSRFVRGERGISFDAASQLCEALCLKLVPDEEDAPQSDESE